MTGSGERGPTPRRRTQAGFDLQEHGAGSAATGVSTTEEDAAVATYGS